MTQWSSNPEFRRRVLELLDAVYDRPPDERQEYLRTACRDEPALYDEVSRLIQDSQEQDLSPAAISLDLLEQSAGGVPALAPGTRLGEYEVVARLATGGMGLVYEARQDNPRRRVALKVLRWAHGAGEAARWIREEAELLARLSHPGIATVYAAGIADQPDGSSLPYLAMEYVEGSRSILEHCEAEGLRGPARLELFRDVCLAVHHAHQRGIIHRDLKPSNILVDSTGHPKLIDLGIAFLTAESGSTDATDDRPTFGTPAYMSPEQAADPTAPADVRCDVYSLGVVLQDLLCGRESRPAEGEGSRSAAAAIGGVELPFRTPLARAEDVRAILRKALATNPDRRYASAASLAEDLERYQNCFPVTARPPSRGYELDRFARRHRWLVSMATVTLVAILGAVVLSTVAARRARVAESKATTALRQEKQARQDEALARQRAAGLAEHLFRVNTDLVFQYAEQLKDVAGTTRLRQTMLENAVDMLDDLVSEHPLDAAQHQQLVRAYVRLGDVLGDFTRANAGQETAARRAYQNALTQLQELTDSGDGEELALLAANVAGKLGDSAFSRADPAAAERWYGEGLTHVDGRASSAARLQASFLIGRLGSTRGTQGDDRGALDHFQESGALLGELLRESPDDEELCYRLQQIQSKIGAALFRLDDGPGALDAMEMALTSAQELVDRSPDHLLYRNSLAGIYLDYAEVLRETGDPETALEFLAESCGIYEDQLASDPANMHALRWTGEAWFHRALTHEALARSGSTSAAGEHRSAALEGYRRCESALLEQRRRGALTGQQAGHLETVRASIRAVREQLEVD